MSSSTYPLRHSNIASPESPSSSPSFLPLSRPSEPPTYDNVSRIGECYLCKRLLEDDQIKGINSDLKFVNESNYNEHRLHHQRYQRAARTIRSRGPSSPLSGGYQVWEDVTQDEKRAFLKDLFNEIPEACGRAVWHKEKKSFAMENMFVVVKPETRKWREFWRTSPIELLLCAVLWVIANAYGETGDLAAAMADITNYYNTWKTHSFFAPLKLGGVGDILSRPSRTHACDALDKSIFVEETTMVLLPTGEENYVDDVQ
ncbi:hypothetical protein LTR17_022925 [Elasticomyces elasticus]|nr:hypothetical protein LTR17_022925 [Elasticomyces elasticus]